MSLLDVGQGDAIPIKPSIYKEGAPDDLRMMSRLSYGGKRNGRAFFI